MTAPDDSVARLVRDADFGRYASALFAPATVRPHLLALYAFDVELMRVRDVVSEPLPGELRLQWWRDALGDPERADAAAHPVARALKAAIAYGRLPREALVALTEARIDDLYDDPVATVADLEGRLGATHAAVLRLATLIAAHGRDPGGAEGVGLAGVAQGVARLLQDLPKQAARGQILLPDELLAAAGAAREDLIEGRSSPGLELAVRELAAHGIARLNEARASCAAIGEAAGPALLPLALVRRTLERQARATDPLSPPGEPPRWRRLVTLWRASRRTPPF